jgi:hypothetical protein
MSEQRETSSPNASQPGRLRTYALGGLLAFVGLNAVGGGAYGLAGAPGVPAELLMGSPFADFFFPSLILLVAVGGSAALGAAAVFGRWPHARRFSAAAGVVLLGWIATQVAMIGWISWLQPFMAVMATLILVLSAASLGTARGSGG